MEAWTRQSPRFDLRSERLNRGYSRKGLADEIGVHREVLRRLENGTGGITPANALLIADWFGVTVVELLGGDAVVRNTRTGEEHPVAFIPPADRGLGDES